MAIILNQDLNLDSGFYNNMMGCFGNPTEVNRFKRPLILTLLCPRCLHPPRTLWHVLACLTDACLGLLKYSTSFHFGNKVNIRY